MLTRLSGADHSQSRRARRVVFFGCLRALILDSRLLLEIEDMSGVADENAAPVVQVAGKDLLAQVALVSTPKQRTGGVKFDIRFHEEIGFERLRIACHVGVPGDTVAFEELVKR